MNTEAKDYTIYNLKTGREVARISSAGSVQDEGDPVAVAELRTLIRQEIVIRESQIHVHAEDAGEEFDAFPEENMCYFGVVTLRPDDPDFLTAFLRRLPYISYYEVRPL